MRGIARFGFGKMRRPILTTVSAARPAYSPHWQCFQKHKALFQKQPRGELCGQFSVLRGFVNIGRNNRVGHNADLRQQCLTAR